MEDNFDWVNIVSDDNELSFLFFDESSNVVEAKLNVDWLVTLFVLAGCFSLSGCLESDFLVFLGLWLVLSEQF